MALGFGSKSRTVDNNTRELDSHGSPNSAAAKEGVFGYDPETNEKKGPKMSRVGGVGVIADSDSQLSVGKQLELEATNSIKYRTCTWQKVILIPFHHLFLRTLSPPKDVDRIHHHGKGGRTKRPTTVLTVEDLSNGPMRKERTVWT